MKKAFVIMIVGLLILFGSIFLLKKFILHEQKKAINTILSRAISVTAMAVKKSSWSPEFSVTGSLRTYKGVNITTELAGMIEEIDFKSGEDVKKGQLLAVLDIRPDIAKLHELESNAKLAKITYFRDKKQYTFGAISKQELDNAEAQYQSTADLVEEQKATIAQKTIRAPFSGRLGISAIYPGVYLNPGDSIVTLQQLDPIYVDFYLPQQNLSIIHTGQTIKMTLDRAPGKTFTGIITTINPTVDVNVRNTEVEATLSNPQHILLPGMFTNVTFFIGKPKQYLTLPYSAITFNPYGSIVYILTKTDKKQNGKTIWTAKQKFVTTGETRGDQIAILKGLTEGEMIVTSGQVKLHNNSEVFINNTVQPPNNAMEKVPERN